MDPSTSTAPVTSASRGPARHLAEQPVQHTDPSSEGFHASWRSFAAVQGGLVAGHMLQAAADVVPGSPRTFSTHSLGPVTPGTPVSTTVRPDRTAGTSTYRVEMRQGGTLVAVAT